MTTIQHSPGSENSGVITAPGPAAATSTAGFVHSPASPPAPQQEDQSDSESGWHARSIGLREQRWKIGQELLELGRNLLGLIRQEPQSASYLAQVHRLLGLGAELSRLSATEALNSPDSECPDCCAARQEWEAALDKIYGKPLPGEETPPISPMGAVPSPHSALNLQPSTR